MRFQVLVPIALAASADAAMAFAPSSSFTPAARTSAHACGAARAGPRLRPAALKMAETEEISQAEYEELLRLAGRGPAEQPAAAAKPAAKQGGGLFGMFGGGGGGGAAAAPKAAAPAAAAPPAAASEWQEVFDEANQAPYWWNVNTGETTWDKPAALAAPAAPPPKPAAAKPAARSGGGLISPGNPVQAKPKPAAKPRVQQAALFDDEDYMSELPPVSASDKPQLQKTVQEQRPAEPTPAPAAARAAPAAAAPSGGGGFFGGLFGGGQKAAAAPAASATPGKEEVSEAELRELMAAAGKNEIAGYSLDVPPGRQAGYKQVKKVVEPNASPASLAPAPVNTGVTELGGVKVTTIRPGDKRNFPQPGDTLTMHYVGKLRDTKQVFDSSIARGQPFEFMIGQGMVIRGWDEGILKMSLGEKAQLVIQSDWGYGATGQGQIPPYADLVFDVDLLAINGVKAGGRFSGGN